MRISYLTYLACLCILLVTAFTDPSVVVEDIPATTENVISYDTAGFTSSLTEGDWNGDGKTEEAIANLTKPGSGNPVDGGVPEEWNLTFSDKRFPDIPCGCCEITLINEGDLDDDGADEISLFQAPMNGCIYSLRTYSLKGIAWHEIINALVPTGCDPVDIKDIENRVRKENGKVYLYNTDVNSEEGKLLKTEVILK